MVCLLVGLLDKFNDEFFHFVDLPYVCESDRQQVHRLELFEHHAHMQTNF